MLLFLGAVEEDPRRNGYNEPLSASPVHQPVAAMLLSPDNTRWMEPVPSVLSFRVTGAVQTNQPGYSRIDCIISRNLNIAGSVFLEIKPELSQRTGYHPLRFPDPGPEDPPLSRCS
jgi:hypothetical protein